MTSRDYDAALRAITDAFRRGGKLLLCGNGGSAADCAHIVGELAKGFMSRRPLPDDVRAAIGEDWAEGLQGGLPAIDLTANSALIAGLKYSSLTSMRALSPRRFSVLLSSSSGVLPIS